MTDSPAPPPAGASPTPAGPLAVLQRIRGARPMPPPGERCEMCGEPIAEEHPHVVSVASRSLMCTCRGCYLLFDYRDAALAYKAVPDRYLSFPDFALTPMQWDDLQIPVGIAFFFRHSELGQTVAFYPGPAGATESELSLGAWEEILSANPALTTMAADVEAILVRQRDQVFDCFLVPIDACYELVGHLRSGWRGFDGGQDVHRKIAVFFDHVHEKSRPARAVAVDDGGQPA